MEHAFGDLKGRFPSLKCLGGVDDLPNLFRAIEALLILHNICIELNDNAREIEDFRTDDLYPAPPDGFIPTEDQDIEQQGERYAWVGLANATRNNRGETDESMKREGRNLRLRILNERFPN